MLLCSSYRVMIEDVPTFPLTITLPDSSLSHTEKRKAAPPFVSNRSDQISNTSSVAALLRDETQSQMAPEGTNLHESGVEGEELSELSFEAMDTDNNGKVSAHELSAAIAGSTGRWPYAMKVQAGGAAIALHALDPALAVQSTSCCCIVQPSSSSR